MRVVDNDKSTKNISPNFIYNISVSNKMKNLQKVPKLHDVFVYSRIYKVLRWLKDFENSTQSSMFLKTFEKCTVHIFQLYTFAVHNNSNFVFHFGRL